MKFLLTICLLLISMPSIAIAQQRRNGEASRPALRGAGAKAAVPVLTRSQSIEAERRLSDMGYWTGAVDGLFDPATRAALIAFQKWEGRAVTGRLTLAELEAIRRSADSKDKETWPKAREVGYAHVEVDLDRQVLLVVKDDASVRVLPVSTGSGKPFKDEGQMSIAYTPRGRFVVYDKSVGWEKDPPLSMYYSNWISGGVAIHGHPNVPIKPASHGCIRIPMFAARELSKLMELGTIVLVYDQISFVSGKPWAENPQLKQAAILSTSSTGYTY